MYQSQKNCRDKRRIVLFVLDFPQLSETFIVNKFLGLVEKGWDVHILCQRYRKDNVASFPALEKEKSFQKRIHSFLFYRQLLVAALILPFALIRSLVLNPLATLRYFLRGLPLFGLNVFRRFYLDNEFIILRPDIVHFEFGTLAVDRTYLKKLIGCKIVVSFRGYDLSFVGLDEPNYYEKVWKDADALHFLGNDLWIKAQKRGCLPDVRHFLIPPAADPKFLLPTRDETSALIGTEDRPLRILSVGRLIWQKGYEFAIEAVAIIKKTGINVEYRIIGDGEYFEMIAFCRHQLRLDDEIALKGYQPSDIICNEMLWADVFLQSSVSEGFSNAVIEAQAMALPVICTDAGGLAENIADGKTGFVVPRREPRALADKMIILARDPVLRQEMGRAGRERAARLFSLDKQTSNFELLYREASEGK